jgi:imidazolonepropionase
MKTLFINIKELLQVRDANVKKVSGSEMKLLPSIKNAYLLIEDELIADFGTMGQCPNSTVDLVIDVLGKMVLPSWCDSHTHLVYAGNREQEFVNRINGMSYEDIAKNGGGILNSAKKLNETTEDELFKQSKVRLEEVIKMGTGAIEIKSGYGLTVDGELKMLRVIKRLATEYAITIKATFLGAHAFPDQYKDNRDGYVALICNEMIPIIADQKLANFIDVFCENGYFSVAQTDTILKAGIKHGLVPKIHVNQFNAIGGVAIGAKNNALTVDHLEVLTDADLEVLKNYETMAVALPGCSFFLGIDYTPARKLIDSGLGIALASDFNPGSAPSGNMNFVVDAACIKMKMTPEEAINAATINGAYAMNCSNTHGSITIGKMANLIVTKPLNSYYELPYYFGNQLIDSVFLKGIEVK